MTWKGFIFAFAIIAIITGSANADVCVYKRPTVRKICGIVVDPNGEPIQNTSVAVLKDGRIVRNVATDESGAFDFQDFESGEYEIEAKVPGFQHARYKLTLQKPINSCKYALRIEMAAGSIHCGGDIQKTKRPLTGKSRVR